MEESPPGGGQDPRYAGSPGPIEPPTPGIEPPTPGIEPPTPRIDERGSARSPHGAISPAATPSATPLALPGAWQLISVGLDLCLRVNASLRTASMAIGFQFLGAVGPLVVLLVVVAGRAPDLFGGIIDPSADGGASGASGVGGALGITALIAAAALVALTIESRIVAVALLGGQAIGRPIAPLEALRRSRQVFWPVVGATVVIQIVVNIAVTVAGSPLPDNEASVVLTTALAALLSVPFVYLVSGIALGAAPALEAIRRSIGMSQTRWRLAIVVSIAETLAQTLLLLALLAGLDILARISDVLGLGLDSGGPTTFLTIVIALLAVAAAGSLVFMVSALAAAPQVVAFVGLTRYAAGLDGARDSTPGVRPVRWLSVPMAIGVGIAVLAALAGIGAAIRAA